MENVQKNIQKMYYFFECNRKCFFFLSVSASVPQRSQMAYFHQSDHLWAASDSAPRSEALGSLTQQEVRGKT